ncbi:CMRF35-like molecule 1 [Seriola lalandi dorsalis]|uniref:CMRF35-like molecule 1 n=1 Tax=Seriola lalandi dorsalis TaxID=1841481 RepID=A0A3B4YY47_SERLL|nr:CMRF35-like molecule 1 [Seriola lalandi dorsalis]
MTVSEVSVKTGGSISIPCLYEPHYRNHVKYLCEGHFFIVCTIVAQTDQPKSSSEKFSIYDDTDQNIFTVSIHDLTHKDSHYWWCGVEIEKNRDVRQYFHLSVTTGMSSLYVDQQKITAFEGGSVTVACHHKYPKVTKWCRLGRNCVTDQSRSIDGTPVTINTSVPNVFTVTMSELTTESSGWYWCVKGKLQMPVLVTVHELTSTTTTTMSPSTADFTGTISTTHQHSSSLMSTEPQTARPTNTIISEGPRDRETLQDEHKRSTKLTVLITILALQLLVVPAAFFGWRMIKCQKSKPEGPDITVCSETERDPEVLYATVVHYQRVAPWKKVKLQNPMPEETVLYSSIVIKDSVQQMAEPADRSDNEQDRMREH